MYYYIYKYKYKCIKYVYKLYTYYQCLNIQMYVVSKHISRINAQIPTTNRGVQFLVRNILFFGGLIGFFFFLMTVNLQFWKLGLVEGKRQGRRYRAMCVFIFIFLIDYFIFIQFIFKYVKIGDLRVVNFQVNNFLFLFLDNYYYKYYKVYSVFFVFSPNQQNFSIFYCINFYMGQIKWVYQDFIQNDLGFLLKQNQLKRGLKINSNNIKYYILQRKGIMGKYIGKQLMEKCISLFESGIFSEMNLFRYQQVKLMQIL
eukprot:TRINITY_DN2277_c2_g1_i2.p2 TRINITY_DN2277_c2_g1~~TRINITY_DN2277_c2_g1_i2.p2  ORF type:complete len:257 (+),score=-3.47 TRINITY_DN2277_c2_g1_i2:122-892(+)